MRIDDPGFREDAVHARVFVDGEEVVFCHTADEELGVAYCYALDVDGYPFIDPVRGGVVETACVGQVRIDLAPWMPRCIMVEEL